MKTKILSGVNAIIALLLTALGFSSCGWMMKYGAPEPMAEYGCPYVSLEVSGQITNEEEQPLKDIQVNLSLYGYRTRAMYSDSVGNYQWRSLDGGIDSVDIIVTDPAGVYEGDSVRVATETNMFDKREGWQEGESVAHQDFQLKKNE